MTNDDMTLTGGAAGVGGGAALPPTSSERISALHKKSIPLTPEEVYFIVDQAFGHIVSLYGRLDNRLSVQTLIDIGKTMAQLSMLRDAVARDAGGDPPL